MQFKKIEMCIEKITYNNNLNRNDRDCNINI